MRGAPTPSSDKRQNERQTRRYGLLLAILLTTYLLSAFLRTRWIGTIELGLFTLAGLLALRNSPFRNRTTKLIISAAIAVSAVMIIVTSRYDTPTGHGVAGLWTALLLLVTVTLLIRQILLMPTVTLQSIFGAISAYLIIGLMFAALYSAMNDLQGSFFAGGQPGNPSTFQYFSFTTLTTLGYGDFTPVANGARAVAMIEAMSGQIFLATLVARLVAAFRPTSRADGNLARRPPDRVFHLAVDIGRQRRGFPRLQSATALIPPLVYIIQLIGSV